MGRMAHVKLRSLVRLLETLAERELDCEPFDTYIMSRTRCDHIRFS